MHTFPSAPFLLCLPRNRKVMVMAGAPAATLDHEVLLKMRAMC